MIAIFSTENDYTTDAVIDWIDYMGSDWYRFNGEDLDNETISFRLSIKEQFSFSVMDIDMGSIKSAWFRRWHSFESIKRLAFSEVINDAETAHKLYSYMKNEITVLSNLLFRSMGIKWITNPEYSKVNKLQVLNLAKEIGLLIPDSMVTNSKKEMLAFLDRHQVAISKPLFEIQSFIVDNLFFAHYTIKITQELVSLIEKDYFYPSLLQEYICKKYELRIFFLDNEFYTMAIFSQLGSNTKIDYRQYDFENMNRMVPYDLPKEVKIKLSKLMSLLKLNCGSIDMIVSETGDYYFLEVNPVGQFGMISYPCNLFLEKKVAEKLIEYDKG